MTRVQMTINGAPVDVDVEARTSLADFLRDTRLLTGTHIGCEHGVCGACTHGWPPGSLVYHARCRRRPVRDSHRREL